MEFLIDTDKRLETSMKIFKKRALDQGADPFMLYPMYCEFYQNNKDQFGFGNAYVYDKACEFFVEGMED